jgi:Ser/Thr protein kinase RdoA (MazF antagonist)
VNHAVVDAVLAQYGLVSTAEAIPVITGTLNGNARVATTTGDVFVRRHRRGVNLARVLAEHDIVAFAAAHEIPVAPPLRAMDGSTAIEHAGAAWAVYPWLDGRTPERGAITPGEAFALGQELGRIHAAFAEHPGSDNARFTMRWDKSETLGLLEKCLALAESRHEVAAIRDALAYQIDLLRTTEIEPPAYFEGLPCQLSHGDYHDQQVLFRDDATVVAVTDWEMFQQTARAWEVVRCLGFAQLLHTTAMDDFLQGYRMHARLSEMECTLAVQLWWQSRVGGAWAWYAYFFEGNERVAEFFPGIAPGLRLLADPAVREHLKVQLLSAAR